MLACLRTRTRILPIFLHAGPDQVRACPASPACAVARHDQTRGSSHLTVLPILVARRKVAQ